MGQSSSKDKSYTFDDFKGSFLKEALMVRDLAVLRYEEFLDMVKELNRMLYMTSDTNDKVLLFAVEKGSDDSIFWKTSVRICCFRPFPATGPVAICQILTLRQFLQAHKMILQHIRPMLESRQSGDENGAQSTGTGLPRNAFTTSMLLKEITSKEMATDLEECCICMERKPEVTLPCTHSYCLLCIEQWNVSNKTCPVCRERVENTDEGWVLPDIPESSEVSAELQNALAQLTSTLSEDS